MTGLSNARNYAAFSILKPGERTVGNYFQDAGIRTMIGGKWQLFGAEHYGKAFRGKGMLPQAAGFDECCLWQVDKLGERYQQPLLNINGKNQQLNGLTSGQPSSTITFYSLWKRTRTNRSLSTIQ